MKVDVTKQAISGMREAAHNFVLSEATTLIVLGNGGMSMIYRNQPPSDI